jgi:hypothetical protein
MVPSKTYLKFKETRSQEDLETLNSYLKRLSEISDILNGDGGVLQFYSLQGIKEYFEIVHIQTQELTSIGFKTAILDL